VANKINFAGTSLPKLITVPSKVPLSLQLMNIPVLVSISNSVDCSPLRFANEAPAVSIQDSLYYKLKSGRSKATG